MDEARIERLIADYAKQYPPLISVQQAMAIIHHDSPGTIYDWSSRGLLNGIKTKPGRHLLLDRDGFVRFLCSHGDLN